jgi:hypothetical protein
MMRRTIAAAACALSLVIVGCGDEDDPVSDEPTVAPGTAAPTAASPAPASTSTSAPPPAGALPLGAGTRAGSAEPGTALAAGTYYTEAFAPRFVVTLGEGWGNAGQHPTLVALLRRPEPGDLALTIDSTSADDVEATVRRLTTIRGTETTAPADTQIAGLPARTFDVTIVDEQVRIAGLNDVYTSFAGDRIRIWVLDAAGDTVTILAESTGEEFETFAAEAEAALAALRFE